MDRIELVIATAILLFGAFCVGFLTHWLVNRLSHVSRDDLDELDRMAAALHDAEEARVAALAEKKTSETRLQARLSQTEAELRATMEGLRTARHEAEVLRSRLEKHGSP